MDDERSPARHYKPRRLRRLFYYPGMVALIFFGFSIGYATHGAVGAGIIVVGLAVIVWYEVPELRPIFERSGKSHQNIKAGTMEARRTSK